MPDKKKTLFSRTAAKAAAASLAAGTMAATPLAFAAADSVQNTAASDTPAAGQSAQGIALPAEGENLKEKTAADLERAEKARQAAAEDVRKAKEKADSAASAAAAAQNAVQSAEKDGQRAKTSLEDAQKHDLRVSELIKQAQTRRETAEKNAQAAKQGVADNPFPDENALHEAQNAAKKAEEDARKAEAKYKAAQLKADGAKTESAGAETALDAAKVKEQKAKEAKVSAETALREKTALVAEKTEALKKLRDEAGPKLKEAQEAVSAAQTQLEAEKQKLTAAETKYSQADAALKEAQTDAQNAKAKLESALKDLNNARQAAEKQKEILEGKKTELSAAEQKLAAARKGTSPSAQAAAKLAAEQEKLREKQDILTRTRAAADEAKKQADGAQAEFAKGAKGLFEYTLAHSRDEKEKEGAKAALAVFETEKHTKKGDSYLEPTRNAGEKDSRTLERMKTALELAKEVNAKRQKDGGIDGRHLSVLGVNDFVMAVAQTNANYSAEYIGHSVAYNPPFEDLYWGPSMKTSEEFGGKMMGSLDGWWDEEKVIFDRMRKEGKKSRTEMDAAAAAAGKGEQVGHYTNLVDDLMWGGNIPKYDSKVIGYALRPGKYGYAHSMVLDYNETGKTFTLDEYTERFMKYYNSVDPQQAQQRYLSAGQSVTEAETAVTLQEKAVREAAGAAAHNVPDPAKIAEYEAQVSALRQDADTAQQQLSVLEGKVSAAQEQHTAAGEQVRAADETVRQKQADLAEPAAGVNKAKAAVQEAEGNLRTKQTELSRIEGGSAVAAAAAALESAGKEAASAEKTVNELTAQWQKLEKERQDAEANLDALREACVQADNAVRQAKTDLETANGEKSAKEAALAPLAALNAAALQARERQSGAQAELSAAQAEVSDAQADKVRATAEISAARERIAAASAAAENAKRTAETAAAALGRAQAELAEKTRVLEEKETALNAAKAAFAPYHRRQKAVSGGVWAGGRAKYVPGAEFTVTFTGFSPYTKNTVVLASTPVVLGVFTADGSGSFTVKVKTPFELSRHTVTATNSWGERAQFVFEAYLPQNGSHPSAAHSAGKRGMRAVSVSAAGRLPQTGYATVMLGALSAASLATGAGILFGRRTGKHRA